jgi:hypothetical protein
LHLAVNQAASASAGSNPALPTGVNVAPTHILKCNIEVGVPSQRRNLTGHMKFAVVAQLARPLKLWRVNAATLCQYAKIAQLVEHTHGKREVPGSIPGLGSKLPACPVEIAEQFHIGVRIRPTAPVL